MTAPGVINFLRMYLHSPSGQRVPIGYVSQFGDTMRMSFDEDYASDPNRLTLSMLYTGATDDDTRKILLSQRDERLVRNDGRWPTFLQNLLPEAHNRERLARQRGCDVDNEFELLAAAGHDLMGALEFEPTPGDRDIPKEVRHWHVAQGLDVLEPGFVEMPVEDGFSLPGVVTKFSAIHDGRRYVVKRHSAAGSHIIKLPSTKHPDLAVNEFMGYRLCAALGLRCASAELATPQDVELPDQVDFETVLVVERFDRAGGRRIHMEEFAQALGLAPKHKYGKDMVQDFGQMLRLINERSARPAQDVAEFLGRLVAFILMGNTDAHLKNWALLYEDGIQPTLAPLYDPVCVSSFFAGQPLNTYAQNRAIDKTLCTFGWDGFEELIRRAGVQRVSNLIRQCKALARQAQAQWPALMGELPTPHAMREEIMERLAGKVAIASTGKPA